ncbi:MAG TPA: DNA polymerase III subunit delta' [Myxococcales bacterium]|jgi:DNA polymerase-3 subunit delta'|nr:DNA polymerase III subunit delta' [Myxococcales bacterium]
MRSVSPWASIVGQDRAVKQLRSALLRDHVHHAYLLAGPDGTGKELIARTFARAANCEVADPAARPCEQCDHCKAIERGNFPDVQLVMSQADLISRGLASKADLEGTASKEIRVDEIRGLARRLSLAALRGRRKIALVLPADAMNERAQNTLLKTLEEPPSATTFLLVSANPDALLPTIRSRCARVQLGPVPEHFLAERLVRDGVPAAEAAQRAARAQGSFSRALAEEGERNELLQDVEKALAASDERAALDLAESYGERGAALAVALGVQAWTRDLLVAQAGAPDEVLESRDLRPLADEVAGRVKPVALLDQAALCAEVIEALEQNGNGRLQLERLFLHARELRHG